MQIRPIARDIPAEFLQQPKKCWCDSSLRYSPAKEELRSEGVLNDLETRKVRVCQISGQLSGHHVANEYGIIKFEMTCI